MFVVRAQDLLISVEMLRNFPQNDGSYKGIHQVCVLRQSVIVMKEVRHPYCDICLARKPKNLWQNFELHQPTSYVYEEA